jgi:chemotaxis protein CheD
MDRYYLYPGKLFASKKPHVVDTILGSCVAVTLWDSVLNIGGINHYMLPKWNGEGKPSCKYGDVAIAELLKSMLDFGCERTNLKAKVFGGSETGISNGFFYIGQRNIELAFDLLNKEQLTVVSNSVGGHMGRKVVFYSESGEVMVKNIGNDTLEKSLGTEKRDL